MTTPLVSTGPYYKNTKAITGNTNIASPTSGQTFVVAQGATTGKIVIECIDHSAVTDITKNSMTYYIYDGTNALRIASMDIPEWTTRYSAFPIVPPYSAPVPTPRGRPIDLPDDTWKVIATIYTTNSDGVQIEARGKIYA